MEEKKFELVSKFSPSGDQPQAIKSLVEGLSDGLKNQVLLGVTGSGKTFTMANIIAEVNRPTLVIAHNKTLAAQLCNELREFFPHNKVEFFVSYYDYYQPEAYIASSDTYIEKDMSVNEEIDKLRSSATAALLGRSDTIVVASVSCIYGLGNPEEYLSLQLFYEKGQNIGIKQVIRDLIGINYVRHDDGLVRNSFRYKGDTLEIMGSTTSDIGVRIEFFGDEIENIYEFDGVSKKIISELSEVSFFPATHYTVGSTRLNNALSEIEKDAEIEVKEFEERGKLIEAQRLKERVAYNVEMIRELGYCSGIENYSRYFDGRKPGEPPFTLLDYFPNGFLTLIDESHMTLPQIRGMYNGDRARKESLVGYGFRLKASFDNRPLNFDEFSSRLGQTIYVSATPGDYEKNISDNTVEQLIRPTGLLDPEIEVLPTADQIAVLMDRAKEVIGRGERVLVTTLTKKMAESLTTYLCEHGLKAKYMHSEIDTIERIEIINSLRSGEFDVLVGINLLREGLDLPEVSMVAILDADKEGFLRSEGALIQTIGRAARNEHGKVLMFADVVTGSMKRAIDETNRRRHLQQQFNFEHGITPKTIKKNVVNSLQITKQNPVGRIDKKDIPEQIEKLKALMKIASNSLDFENAIKLRDEINALKKEVKLMEEFIKITGARENNLKNINLTIPRNKLVVFTGVSGSGKSTLAFDTIFAEGQRRYMESLSSYARQFLGQSSKPEVDRIEGLSPSIAIDQKTTNHNPRSTVGTVTEIYDYMRLLFAKIGVAYCPRCHKPIKRQSVDQIIDRIAEYPQGSKLLILAPIARGQKGTFANKFEELKKDGFVRVEVDGKIYTLDEEITLEKNIKHDIYVVVDRVVVKNDIKSRLSDSVELAIKTGDGIVVVESDGQKEVFSTLYACDECGYSIEEITPRMFSFNSPYGACEHCTGLGFTEEIDPKLIIKDPNKSLNQGAVNVSGWNFTNSYMTNIYFKAISKQYGINLNMPLKDMPKDKLDIVLYGNHGEKLNYHYSSLKHSGDMTFSYEGVIPNLERRFRETTSDWIKQEIAKYMRQTTCSVCGGKRLKPSVLNIKINELNISEMSDMSVDKLIGYFEKLKLGKTETEIAKPILKEIVARLKFLQNVGLGYLTLSRSAESLSGGESQRIRLATQIGSGLTGVLYILDEPSIGLHQSDNTKLLDTLKALRDEGNTVIVVEHDEDTIRAADFVVDIGKFAGVHGGEVVVAGTPQEVMDCKESITGAFLSGRDKIIIPEITRKGNGGEIKIRGAYLHNLKNVDVSFPLGEFTVVTGVSGSGKSSLVNGVLCPGVRNTLQKEQFDLPAKSVEIVGEVDKIIDIDQSPIGRTPRSNPATYVGVFTPIRELFASTIDAKERGYSAGRFSFNVKGGRCENCEGDGVKEIEMYFLPEIVVPCEVCKGKRYNRETLEVKYKGKSIFDVLDMTIEQALKFFEAIPQIKNKLQALFDVGLGYIKLGQSSTTLSGGEAQRVKLATELSKRSTGKTLYILDEPTTGLSTYDVKKLIQILQTLVDRGNTVVVIEHNLDVIKVADNIIDLGPHGGDQGGEIVAKGTPKEVAKRGVGLTAEFLKQYF